MNNLIEEDIEFNFIINDIIKNPTVQQMHNFKQHYETSCFDHCLNVSYYSYLICKKFNLNYTAAARSGMLHDLFLYDWRIKEDNRTGLHAFTHPRTALINAQKYFELNKKEEDIILKHMWPVTIKLPKYKESYIITLVDKFCALQESFNYYKTFKFSKKAIRYAYLILNILILTSIEI